MKLLIAIASMLMLSSLAIAAPDNSQLGPYTVSFDMNTDMPYQLRVHGAHSDGSWQLFIGMQIFTIMQPKQIMISEYKARSTRLLECIRQLSAMGIALNGFNATNVEDMTIDGKEGFLITSEPFQGNNAIPADAKLYRAMYWMDSKNCECGPVSVGTTSVDLTSSYPQDVTENLLGSLHVVKGQAAAMPSTQDMPPATN